MKNLGKPGLSRSGNDNRSGFVMISALPLFLLAFLFLFQGSAVARSGASAQMESSVAPWIGVWTIIDGEAGRSKNSDTDVIVEIRPTGDGKGLEITRKDPKHPDVKEVVIPDGIKRPVEAQNCSGWQATRWDSGSGLLVSFSETNCKDSGILSTTSLRMILSADRMADILAVKASGQTRLAVRRLAFKRDLASGEGFDAGLAGAAMRSALSAPWDLDRIIQLSKEIETPILEAALLEKKIQIRLTSGALKRMRSEKVPDKIIDLLVALASPDKFEISRNGQVELRPFPSSTAYGSSTVSYPVGPTYFYPGVFYNCYDPFGWLWGYPYASWLSHGACYSYYSPFWWDYPIYIPYGGSGGALGASPLDARADATRGYTQIEPRNTGRRAAPRQSYHFTAGYSGASSQTTWPGYSSGAGSPGSYSSGGSSSGEGGGGGGASSSAPGASPGGYSSGSSGGSGQAVPR